MLLIPWWPTSCFLTQENNCNVIVVLPSFCHCQIRAGLLFICVLYVFVCFCFFWSDGFCQAVETASSSSSASREHELQHTAGLSVFKVLGLSHTAAPLAFIFVCLFVVVLFFLCLSLSDVGMLRFQTSVALWDRSSVSAGSVTVSLYQLRCLVEVWVFPKLCFFFFFYFYFFNILFYYIIIFLFVFWVGLGVLLFCFLFVFFKLLLSPSSSSSRSSEQALTTARMDGWIDWWMDGWMGDRWDAAQFGTLRVFLPWEEVLFFSKYKKKGLLWLFNCLSVTFYPSPQQLWIQSPVGFSLFLSLSVYLHAISQPISVVCHVHHAGR